MKKTKYSDFFGPEKSSNPKIFLFLKFSNSGQPSRLFKKMGLCDFSANGTPIDKLLNFTCNKMKKEKNVRKKSEKCARNPKKNRKKNRRKNDVFFFFFKFQRPKKFFQPDFFFFQFCFVFFFFWPSILYRSLKRLGVVSPSLVHYAGGGLLRVTPVVVGKALLVGGGGRANKPPPAVVGVIEATPHTFCRL